MTTPLEPAPERLIRSVGAPDNRALLLKREDRHELGAFKWRGALPTVERYRDQGASRVVTASTGNHGAATAWACKRLGLGCVVFGPADCSDAKAELIGGQAAELVLGGADLDEAKAAARAHASEIGQPFFEDGSEPAQFEGYAAIGTELLEQLGEPPGSVVVPLGNGALLIGVGRALKAAAPRSDLAAVVAKDAPVMARSLAAGTAVEESRCETFADGLAVRIAIPDAVRFIGKLGCSVVEVSEREIAGAVGVYADSGLRVEGSAAAALAALPAVAATGDGPIVLLVTGRNIDDDLHRRAVEHPETFPD